jgi:hypothetical protein
MDNSASDLYTCKAFETKGSSVYRVENMTGASSQHGYSCLTYRMNYAESVNCENSVGNCIMRSVMNLNLHQLLLK